MNLLHKTQKIGILEQNGDTWGIPAKFLLLF